MIWNLESWIRAYEGDYEGDVAQLGEHLICIQGVAGSIPVISTITLRYDF